MTDWKRRAAPAAFDKRGKFGFIGIAEPIDKLRERLLILAHRERLKCDWLGPASSAIGFDRNGGQTLIKAADVNLTFFSEDDRLRAITGYMVAAYLHLS